MSLNESCILTILKNREMIDPFTVELMSNADVRDCVLKYWYTDRPQNICVIARCLGHSSIVEHYEKKIRDTHYNSYIGSCLHEFLNLNKHQDFKLMLDDTHNRGIIDELMAIEILESYFVSPKVEEWFEIMKEIMTMVYGGHNLLGIAIKNQVDMKVIDNIFCIPSIDQSLLIAEAIECSNHVYLDRILSNADDNIKNGYITDHLYSMCDNLTLENGEDILRTMFKHFNQHQCLSIRDQIIRSETKVCSCLHSVLPDNDPLKLKVNDTMICRVTEPIFSIIKRDDDDIYYISYDVAMLLIATTLFKDEIRDSNRNNILILHRLLNDNSLFTIDEALENKSIPENELNSLLGSTYLFILDIAEIIDTLRDTGIPLIDSIIDKLM